LADIAGRAIGWDVGRSLGPLKGVPMVSSSRHARMS
jgi:hypothetical protein